MRKKVIVLGATGSIGLQSLDVIMSHPESFELIGMSVGRRMTKLEKILEMVQCPQVCVLEECDAIAMQEIHPEIQFLWGEDGLLALAGCPEADVVINGISGFAGLAPSLAVIQTGHDLALANKETLVVGGALVKALASQTGSRILPVDSEHSAIFQCLNGEPRQDVSRLIITASGGSFRNLERDQLVNVTKEDALKHPNWSMGAGITIDSATMFNKALEIIEAHWLFDLDFDHIDVVMHPESVIHSMVEFKDGAVMAQMGVPDMRLPIQYALTYPNRMSIRGSEPLDLVRLGKLTFRKMDFARFPALKIAYDVGRTQKTYPAVLNGAKEQATELFLKDQISFLDIEYNVIAALRKHQPIDRPNYEELKAADAWARAYVKERAGV